LNEIKTKPGIEGRGCCCCCCSCCFDVDVAAPETEREEIDEFDWVGDAKKEAERHKGQILDGQLTYHQMINQLQ